MAAGCDVSKSSTVGHTRLHRATQFNQDAIAIWLLEKDASPLAVGRFLNTPLHIAAVFNAVTGVKFLLSYGAQLNRAAADGRTPLYCACEVGSGDAVTALL